jgi:DNA-binding response OmpR family regulator
MKLPYRIIVLDDDEDTLSGVVELLRDSGHHVTGAATFDAAKRLLAVSPFDLLISDVRLRAFNGLHLVMQARADHPEMAVIIMTGFDDPLIDLEAHRYHADLVRKPIRPAEFRRTVTAALASVRRQRRWPRKRVVGGFRVTIGGRPAAVVDVSYGGLRLELPQGEPLPDAFDVEVAGIGLHLEVEGVWSQASPSASGTVCCGATLSAEHSPAARTWRSIVDRLNP